MLPTLRQAGAKHVRHKCRWQALQCSHAGMQASCTVPQQAHLTRCSQAAGHSFECRPPALALHCTAVTKTVEVFPMVERAIAHANVEVEHEFFDNTGCTRTFSKPCEKESWRYYEVSATCGTMQYSVRACTCAPPAPRHCADA